MSTFELYASDERKKEVRVCPDCDGDGEVGGYMGPQDEWEGCPTCGATGFVPNEPPTIRE